MGLRNFTFLYTKKKGSFVFFFFPELASEKSKGYSPRNTS